MVRRRSFTSISGVALTGSRTMISATRTSPREPERCATAKSSSRKVSMPAMRPPSITTREPRFSFAMVFTASAARCRAPAAGAAGSMLTSRLPLTSRISFPCMARSSHVEAREYLRGLAREYSRKAAVVTGGAQGIGRATAELLAARGYAVVIADADVEAGREAEAASGLVFVRCDVASERSVHACINRTLRRFGRLDALINNAGIASPETGPVQRLALREWNRRLAVNLTGMFLMAKHAAVALRRARGAIVNIASTRALQSR